MKQSIFEIIENKKLTENVYRMKLKGDVSNITSPGQFIDIAIEGFFLRRPISVCDVNEDVVTIIYKVVGDGTQVLSKMINGDKLDILTGLGHGYDLDKTLENPLLIGGGVGVPPLYYLAKQLIKQNKKVSVILGFNTASEIFYEKQFIELGCEVFVTTVDGSYGTKGFVTNCMDLNYSSICCCGPLPMLKAVNKAAKTSGQYSFEERMGCGVGACMGCVMKDKDGNSLRVCKEGPVIELEAGVL